MKSKGTQVNIQQSFSKLHTQEGSPGKLYLVATPIGNLEDMTFRAIRMLKEVSVIAAEDTRQTRKLLSHYDISTKLVSYYAQNQDSSGIKLIQLLIAGKSIALVSDAGIPAISDPGYELVKLAIAEQIDVVPIPGANAALSALIASGLSTHRFVFVGFLPRKKSQIMSELSRLRHHTETILIYESPHRVEKTLLYMEQVWGGHRKICLARELTKTFEELIRGSLSTCMEHVRLHPPRGEYCLVVEGSQDEPTQADSERWEHLTLDEHVHYYVSRGKLKKEAIKQVALDRKLQKREVYNFLMRIET